ncbi:MAG: DUF2283 domain-containing protein [Candidatus Omnitrophica bacterium]|nr:DUF2283 domain-containing protein [Candidatus Omnitrophota bacterium]
MIVTYDTLAEAFYFQLKPKAKIAKTVELNPNTLVDLDENNDLVGVELLHPSPTNLRRVAQQFHRPELSKVDTEKLQEAFCG